MHYEKYDFSGIELYSMVVSEQSRCTHINIAIKYQFTKSPKTISHHLTD